MRKIILLFLLQCLPIAIFAQGNIEKRIVYLWDVTYSMHGGYAWNPPKNTIKGEAPFTLKDTITGKIIDIPHRNVEVAGKDMMITHYKQEYDIYTSIVNKLVADIESQNARTEIVVIPFNDKVLQRNVWRKMATTDGKRYLANQIRNYFNAQQTNTSIYTPLKFAKDEIFVPNCPNVLKILSDGIDNCTTDKFYNLLDNWCDCAEEKNIQGYYFVLTDKAENDELKGRLEKSCFKILYDNPAEPTFELPDCNVNIENSHSLRVFEDYDKDITLPLYMSNGELKDDAKIHVSIQENDYIELEQDVVITNQTSQLVLKPTFKKSRETMMQELPTATYTKLQLKFAKLNDGSNLVLENTSSTLLLVNRKMKSMQITIK